MARAAGTAPGARVGPSIAIRSLRGPHPVSKAALGARALRMLGALGLEGSELSVLLVDDETMRALNRRHRRIDRSTDVLSFSMLEGEHAERAAGLLGDVVVSVATARRQAREAGIDTLEQVTRLLAHGLLHLVGHEHESRGGAQLMRREEARLLREAAGARAGRALARGATSRR
jgi:probable rRNA maturation factor